MSAEFMTEYNESTIKAAVENMERTMRGVGSIDSYIEDIQEGYAQMHNGNAELSQLLRVAQFITHNKAGDIGNDVQAVYHGELLGLELINYIEPDNGKPFKGGFAQAFMKHRLDASRKGLKGYEHDKGILRIYSLIEDIQEELTPTEEEDELNPLYTQFGQRIVKQLSDNPSQQELALMGFRMIVTEALSPSMHQSTHEALELFERMVNIPVTPSKDTFEPAVIHEQLADTLRVSDEKLETMMIEPEDIEWIDIPEVRKNIINEYIQLLTSRIVLDSETKAQTKKYLEEGLSEFNHNFDLLSSADILNVCGEQFAVVAEANESEIVYFTNQTDIRGAFGGIYIVDVPSNKSLLRTLAHPNEYEKILQKPPVPSPAIRIMDPSFITQLDDGSNRHDTALDAYIDIPLTYKNVDWQRLKPEAFDDTI